MMSDTIKTQIKKSCFGLQKIILKRSMLVAGMIAKNCGRIQNTFPFYEQGENFHRLLVNKGKPLHKIPRFSRCAADMQDHYWRLREDCVEWLVFARPKKWHSKYSKKKLNFFPSKCVHSSTPYSWQYAVRVWTRSTGLWLLTSHNLGGSNVGH